MKNKIVQFIGSFHQGGSERQALQLAKLLREAREFEVSILTLDKSGSFLEEAEAAGFDDIREYKIETFLSVGFLLQTLRCAKYLRRNKIDIVHTHDFYTNVFGIFAARLAGVPVRIASKREMRGFRTAYQERLERLAYRFSMAITVNAKAVEKYLLAAGVDRRKINLTYNGLDIERMKPNIKDRAEICRVLELDPEKRFVTLVANLRHEVKNQPMLLRCAKRLKEEFPDVCFVFAGEGERKRFLIEMSRKLNVEECCRFIDRCQIVPELLSVSEICVLTSYSEGFPNSILEYMALSRPVVATNVGGVGECLEDSVNGFLVGSDDDRGMSEKLRVLLNDKDLARKFGIAGRETVESRFSTDIQLQEVTELYRGLLLGV